MSFKLVGDQFSQINVTQKRRRSDLLLQGIPDDEALLMKNGRYACLVCSHRPTFDTVEMLCVHRRGQKHAAAAVRRADEQAAFQMEVMKRRQNHSLAADKGSTSSAAGKSGGTSKAQPPLITATQESVQRALSKWSSPYDPRSIRHKTATSLPSTPQSSAGAMTSTAVSGSGSQRSEKNAGHAPGGACSSSSDQLPAKASSADKPPEYVFPLYAGQSKKKKKPSGSNSLSGMSAAKVANPKEKEKAERIKRLQESGWVLCNNGTWVKDPSAEFDSDEEPPSPL